MSDHPPLDTEPDDQFVRGNIPDADQVARRLHELRKATGEELPEWDVLDGNEQNRAIVLMSALLAWLDLEGTR